MHKALMIKILNKRGITKLSDGETLGMAMDKSGGYPTKEELIMANKKEKHYISFGQIHEHVIDETVINKHYLFEVQGDYEKARSVANLLFGKHYANIYPEERLSEIREYYVSIISIAGWSYKTDYKKYHLKRIVLVPTGLVSGVVSIIDEMGNRVMSINFEGGQTQVFERMGVVLMGEPYHEFIGTGQLEVQIDYD